MNARFVARRPDRGYVTLDELGIDELGIDVLRLDRYGRGACTGGRREVVRSRPLLTAPA